jgi:tetratricopeptide (TPR) repeat protein
MQIALGHKIDNAVVQTKSKLLEKLEKGYHEVVQYQSPNWTLAALHRSYEINREFALFLQNAPLPKLSEEQKVQYRELIAQKAKAYMDKAEQYRAASVTQARKWLLCDPALAVWLFDSDGPDGHFKQALPFSSSPTSVDIAKRFLDIEPLKALHEQLMHDPNDLQQLLALADAYMDARDYKQAVLISKKVLDSVAPGQKQVKAAAYNLLGMAYLYKGNDPSAKDAFQKALIEEPENISAKVNLAGLFEHYGHRQQAEKMFKAVSGAKAERQAGGAIHPRAKELLHENNRLAKK